jgi:prevent-host-death family protein
MQTINIHEAKTHLSRLVDEAAKGNVFIIAKAGKPMVKVLPLSEGELKGAEKLGFMSGEISVPDDFDSLAAEEMIRLFEGKSSWNFSWIHTLSCGLQGSRKSSPNQPGLC